MEAVVERPSVAKTESVQEREGFHWYDAVLLAILLPLWLVLFLAGVLVDSAPYRARFAAFEGGIAGSVADGLIVLGTYTLLNVAMLTIVASVLGSIGATVRLGPDATRSAVEGADVSSPRSAAVLRGFLVYLTLISGLIIFADTPAEPTQSQYVKSAGFISVIAFIVSYKPTLFAGFLDRCSRVLSDRQEYTSAR